MLNLRFSIAIVVLAALTVTFALLGRWQLTRAEVNRALDARQVEAGNLPTLVAPDATADPENLRWRRIAVAGRYHAEVQVLLDNMVRDGIVGFEVLTPFLVSGDHRALLINRGWVAADPSRVQLPAVALDADIMQLAGVIDRLPRAGIQLGDAELTPANGLVVLSFPDAATIGAAVGLDVYGYQVRLDAAEPAGFNRDWPVRDGLADRNLAYAVQWFALAALALVLALGAVYRARRGSLDQRL